MSSLILGAVSLAALCALWALWQRAAEHLDPGTNSDRRAGGRCCVPTGGASGAAPRRARKPA